MHTFCDASDKAYAAVSYIRAVYNDGSVTVKIVASKSLVAPLKPLSIPRLELQAALIGARLADTIVKSLPSVIHKKVFWSNSRTVLCWLRSEPRNYRDYVANRLGEMDELSEADSWKWVPTAENPADDATKCNRLNFSPLGRWFAGPEFLSLIEREWPEQPPITKEEYAEKIKIESRNLVFAVSPKAAVMPDPSKFSSWSHLRRVVAKFFFAKELWLSKLKNKIKPIPKHVSVEHYEIASTAIFKEAQRDSFPREICALENQLPISEDSRLSQFTPFLQNGLLKVQGRASRVKNVPVFSNTPVILDGGHAVTRLLIRHYHEKMNHANVRTLINEIRQKFCITKLTKALKSVITHCALCQLRRAKPTYPRMGDLPEARLDHGCIPFAHCGIDYFGPFRVAIGRKRDKRWGVLFTCLTTRAVHLEIADSLSADSAIMAIQRMTARRGQPSVFYSDNGTNLRGASEELREALRELDNEKLLNFGAKNGIKWVFIPPAAPHMGGSWESLVKCVKNALYHTLKTDAPREEILRTLFAEAEHSVNSRPLFFVSSDPDDPEAITPNHILFGASSREQLPRRYEDLQGSSRKSWARAQGLADVFWRRWRLEYLPTLITRQKWTSESKNLEVGDVVIIYDNLTPRNMWRKGIIQEVFPGEDHRVRSTLVKTSTGFLKRPTTKLQRLELASQSNKNSSDN